MFLDINPTVPVRIDDPSTWPVQMPTVATILNVPAFNDLLTIVNDVPDLGKLQPQLPNPKVIVGDALQDLQQLMSVLDSINLPAGLDLSLDGSGFDNQSYRVRFLGRLRLATKDGDRIDVGVGKLSGEMSVGADIAATVTGPSKGLIFFEIGGDLQQGIIPPLLYAGGMLKFQIRINESGDTDWQLDAGTVASIGGELIPDLVELEATVHYAYLLRPDLRPGIRLGMDARAKLLDGLLGVKFGVDASVSVYRPGGAGIDTVRIEGDVMAMGEITAAWVFDTDFSRRFRFHQDIELRYV